MPVARLQNASAPAPNAPTPSHDLTRHQVVTQTQRRYRTQRETCGQLSTHPSKLPQGTSIHRKKAELRQRHPLTRREMRKTGRYQCSTHQQLASRRRRRAQHQQHKHHTSNAASPFQVQPTTYSGCRGNITMPRCSSRRPVFARLQHRCYATRYLVSVHHRKPRLRRRYATCATRPYG